MSITMKVSYMKSNNYTIILCCPCYMSKYVPRLEGIMHDPQGQHNIKLASLSELFMTETW